MNVKQLLLIGSLAAIAGCSSVPIHNVNDASVVTGSGRPATVEQVRNAIVKAGTGLGWTMTAAGPGLLTGRIAVRGHDAAIDVRYSPRVYSIVYKDSSGLEFREGQIHKNYNGWVENLDRDVRRNLLSL